MAFFGDDWWWENFTYNIQLPYDWGDIFASKRAFVYKIGESGPVFHNTGAIPSIPGDWSVISEIPVPAPLPAPTAPATDEGEPEMAHDWGHILAQTVGGIAAQAFAPPPQQIIYPSFGPAAGTVAAPAAGASVMETLIGTTSADCGEIPWDGGTPPKGYKVVNWCGRGVLRKIRRKRRPRILTGSDASDIATIVGLVGKGQMASALINRARR